MSTDDLFATQPVSALNAFDEWACRAHATRGLNEATEAVQRAMWTAFAMWCISKRIDPATLTAAELDAYLRSREGTATASELTPRYAWRLVRLVGQVVAFLALEQGKSPNTAAADLLRTNRTLRLANDDEKDPRPEFLTDAEDRRLVSFLESSVPRPGRDAGLRWQDIRNRTAVALQRGAGLTPLEIRSLRVADVFVDPDARKGAWKVRAPGTGSVSAHDAPVARWARPLLLAWLRMREALDIPGDWLFPSTRTGKQLSKSPQFKGCSEVLAAAGLTGASATGGGYKLRNTFAIRQLADKKHSDADVAGWLGIAENEMARYRTVMTSPIDVR